VEFWFVLVWCFQLAPAMAASMAAGSNPSGGLSCVVADGGGLGVWEKSTGARSLVKVSGGGSSWSSKGSFSGGQIVPLLKPGARRSHSLSFSPFFRKFFFAEVSVFV